MPSFICTAFVLTALLALPAAAGQTASAACPFTPEQLTKVFGQAFPPGKEEPGGLGPSCAYAGKAFTVRILTVPAGGPPPEQMRKMMKPPRTKWTPIPNDPDGALIETQVPDVPPYPAISYIRKGVLVELHVTGMFYDDLSRRAQAIEAMNTKLASLPRVP